MRIPAVQERPGIGEGPLGVALLGAAVGALLSMSVAGALVSRLGSRRVVGVTTLLLAGALPLLALAPSLPILVGALLFAGASNRALDVSMNAHAVAVEKGYGRPIMSSFHAAFSLGGLIGSVLGGLIAAAGTGVLPHFLAIFVLLTLATGPAYRALLPSSTDRGKGRDEPAFVRPTRGLLGLGVISFCVLLGEGAMADWSSVYLSGTLETGPGFAAAGYAAFSLTMAAERLIGDRLTQRLDR